MDICSKKNQINDLLQDIFAEYNRMNETKIQNNCEKDLEMRTMIDNIRTLESSEKQKIDEIRNLKKKGLKITLVDPNINKQDVFKETGIMALNKSPRNKKYSIILFGLYHDQFKELSKNNFKEYCFKNTIIFDLTNTIKGENIIHF